MSKRAVFISHSQRDASLARQLANNLTRLGLTALNPTRRTESSDWRRQTQSAIRKADALVLIASPERLTSSWVLYEAGAAEALGKRVLVLLPDRHLVAELPEEISVKQVVDFDPQSLELAAQAIAARLAAA